MTAETTKTRYRVEGMDCASCAMKIDTAVRKLPGIGDVSVSATTGAMVLEARNEDSLSEAERLVRALGYGVERLPSGAMPAHAASTAAGHSHDHGHDHDHDHDHDHPHGQENAHGHGHDHGAIEGSPWTPAKARLTAASGLALLAAYVIGHLVPSSGPLAFAIAMLVGLLPIAGRALAAARAGIPFTIETLMTIAAIGAVAINAGEEAAAVVFLFLVGELLEGFAAGRARASIRSLTDLVPKTALLEEGGTTRTVEAERLAVGARIVIRPGDRIPADGTILEGASAINEAPVTGESTPVRKQAGSQVFAGTINGEAVLKVQVTAAAADNTIARVVRLVEEAQEAKSPTERFIDRFSRYYTPGVLAVGLLVAILPPLFGGAWSEWIYKGLAVLLIGCPCALVISTPAAIAASLSAGARRGLLLKGGAVLETFGKIDCVALDKTGTLTEGKPQVTDILSLGVTEAEVLRLAAALESGSSHPLAQAILERAKSAALSLPAATEGTAIGGKGVTGMVEGRRLFLGSPQAAGESQPLPPEFLARIQSLNDEGKSVSVLTSDGTAIGALAMRDEPRPDARQGLEALKRLGIRLVMLTGDNERTARAIGRQLGMDDVRAGLMPEDKQAIVSTLKASGLHVAKVGDGINDAPALAAADIGIAMGGGTDVALETADAAILNGRVLDLARMVRLSRITMRNIAQNITIALGLKAVFLVTTILGVTGLWPAILADTGATVLVTMNALRLLSPRVSDAAEDSR